MKPNEIKEGTILYIIEWNPMLLKHDISICEVSGTGKAWYKNHVYLELNWIINHIGFEGWELYYKIDLNRIYCEVYDYDDCIFVTCNERLFTKILKQLIENKSYDKSLIRRFLYYD